MTQIGGDASALFSLTAAELASLQACMRDEQIGRPVAIHPEGPAGALVRFHSFDEAMLVKVAIA